MPSSLMTPLVDASQVALQKRVDTFEGWLAFWTAMVVLGLMYEYGCEFAEPTKQWPPGKPWPFRWVVRLEKLGAIFVIVGVAGELYVEVMASPAHEALRKFNDVRLAEANGRYEALRKKNLVLQAEVLKLREKLADRHLTREQQRTIASKLRRFSGQKVDILVFALDSEAKGIAEDILDALKPPDGAGWNVTTKAGRDGPPAIMASAPEFGSTVPGIGIEIQKDANPTSMAAGRALLRALTDERLSAEQIPVLGRYTVYEGAIDSQVKIKIIIGRKP
jgi:hypothetical protein